MRQLTFTPRKLRGQRRLFRWLTGWKNSFAEWHYSRDILEYPYCNEKIPVPFSLVQGKKARMKTVIRCVQLLLDAAALMAANRPDWARDTRVICSIATPDMFGSEICLYIDEEYFQHQISDEHTEYSIKERIAGKSLARRWNLTVPAGFRELGIRVFNPDPEDGDYKSEWWFFGEVE